jgi:hypothetical protein
MENTCSQCGDVKVLELFSKCTNSNGERVYSNQCKVCVAKNNKIYRDNNKEKLNKQKNEWVKERRKDPLYKIRCNLSRSFLLALQKINTSKPAGTMTYTGCTNTQLIKHLNQGEYTMKDYDTNTKGNIKFHIDHIIPSDYYINKLVVGSDKKITKETEPWLHNWWNYRNLRVWPAVPNILKSNDMDYELFKQHGIEDLLTIG